jgi:hypothetical protein
MVPHMKVALQLRVGHMQKFMPCAVLAKLLVHQLSTPHLNLAHILAALGPAPKPSLTLVYSASL